MDAPARETGLASRSDGEQPVVEPLQPAPRRRRGRGRLELEAVTVKSMNELKRSGVVDGKIRTVTNAQNRRLLQLIVEQAHDAALAVFVERGGRFVEKDPSRFVQQEAREGEALLFAERQFLVPALSPVKLGDETAEIASLQGFSNIRFEESVGGARIAQGVAQCAQRQVRALRQKRH